MTLRQTLRACRRCIYPETKPNLWFDDTGLCSACIAFDAREQINWEERADEFGRLFTKGSRVVVACSGGKDSHYIIIKLKELGLNPLAVCATTDDLSLLGRKNLDNVGRLCDLIEVTPDKSLRRQMSRYALETVGDISWCEHVLIWAVPARIASALGIPYVFYGENPQNEYGAGPKETQQMPQMPDRWEHEFGGMLGLRVSDMREQFPDGEFNLYTLPLKLPSRVFLGYYFPWDGAGNAKRALAHGFQCHTQRVETSFATYENLDNHQTGIHDYLRYVKYGYTRAADIACSYIRRGVLTREEVVKLMRDVNPFPKTYLGKPIEEILDGIDMTLGDFMDCVDRFANRELFEVNGVTLPRPKFKVE
jgi:N-acetyl sugar amidotransferase